MTDAIAHKLRIKYGLTRDPSDVQITKWRRRVEEAIANGDEPEQAGRAAALEAFGELDAILLFSEADTIKALLAEARSN
ncbi:hypothetical protein U1707_00220 [Sphingomonas sp. PB2P12]|uniref:hypothetical protein n=1 Tax=Sphingomonas sandaracina TaxID=3096157 RepID=UPI002FC8E80E